MLPHLLILLAGIYLGFCLGLFVTILRIRAVHGRRSSGILTAVVSSTPEVHILSICVVNGSPLTHQETQRIAAHLRLQ